jgi:hypothetical protein
MPKITKRLVEAAEVREKDYIICDDELRGFAVRVLPSGKRYYVVQYRIGTRYRRMSLGQHGVLTAETARRTAFNLLLRSRLVRIRQATDRRVARRSKYRSWRSASTKSTSPSVSSRARRGNTAAISAASSCPRSAG